MSSLKAEQKKSSTLRVPRRSILVRKPLAALGIATALLVAIYAGATGAVQAADVRAAAKGLDQAVSLATDGNGYCALLRGGNARCWGSDSFGAVGISTSNGAAYSDVAVSVRLAGALSLTGGRDGYCAVLRGGGAKCWGADWDRSGGVPFPQETGVASLASDGKGYCALLRSRSVGCWGSNFDGMLGDGGTESGSGLPVTVRGIAGVASLASDSLGYCALLRSGTAMCWGANEMDVAANTITGLLGNGGKAPSSLGPVTVKGLADATSLASDGSGYCALLKGGAVECWGVNEYGALGDDGSAPSSGLPVSVKGLSDATSLASDGLGYCALLRSRTVSCWGLNEYGELGGGTNEWSSNLPVSVRGLTDVRSLASDGDGECAVLWSGGAKCWGANKYGQLGDGGTEALSNVPVNVRGLTGAARLASDGDGECALLRNGEAECWGLNDEGELGDGTIGASTGQEFSNVPVRVAALGPSPGPTVTTTTTTVPTTTTTGVPTSKGSAPKQPTPPQTATRVSPTWRDVTSSVGTAPPGGGGLMAYDAAGGYSVLFGGVSTWIFENGRWSELDPKSSPSPRSGAVMVYDAADGYVLLFGGSGCGGTCDDTWAFKGGQWTQLHPSVSPPARTEAAMAYDPRDGYSVLFGGVSAEAVEGTVYGDTWTFRAGGWTEQSPAISPPARAGAGLVYDAADDHLVMFDGYCRYASVCDVVGTWAYSGGQWAELATTISPDSRWEYGFAYDPSSKAAVLFGGWDDHHGCNGDRDDTWEFRAGQWSQVSLARSPSDRGGAAMDYDPHVGILLFGGGDSNACTGTGTSLDDTWEFRPVTTTMVPRPTPTTTVATTTTTGVPTARGSAPKQLAELAGPDTHGAFGNSVAISGATIVVGAPDFGGGAVPGRAFVFTRSALGWQRVAKLTESDPQLDDAFGQSVAISGTTIVVGAPGHRQSAKFQGAAYVFTQTAGRWHQTSELASASTDPDVVCPMEFGSAVAISGTTIVIGSFYCAYVFIHTTTGWQQSAELTSQSGMGSSFAISGTTLVAGSAVLAETTTGWQKVFQLTGSEPDSGSAPVTSVAISGSTILLGAPNVDHAYVLTQTVSGWRQTAELTGSAAQERPSSQSGDQFGSAVAISGTSVFVGALGANRVDEFTEYGSRWRQVSEFEGADTGTHDNFGTSLAASGSTIVVGAPGFGGVGQAYVFRATTKPRPTTTTTVPRTTTSRPAPVPYRTSCTVSYTNDSYQGPDGFGWVVTVTNDQPFATTGWSLSWTLPGIDVSLVSASGIMNIVQEGSSWTVSSSTTDGSILPRESAQFQIYFMGYPANSGPTFTSCTEGVL